VLGEGGEHGGAPGHAGVTRGGRRRRIDVEVATAVGSAVPGEGGERRREA
jgi:hypothetical protein